MRILLDTNLLVRAAITPKGSAREILRLIEASADHTLVISAYLLSEVTDVLRRDRIRARWPLTDEESALIASTSHEPLKRFIRRPFLLSSKTRKIKPWLRPPSQDAWTQSAHRMDISTKRLFWNSMRRTRYEC